LLVIVLSLRSHGWRSERREDMHGRNTVLSALCLLLLDVLLMR